MTSCPTSTQSGPSSTRSRLERAVERYVQTMHLSGQWIPHRPHPKQQQFLLADEIEEVLYGGAAGGGKTDALLMAALQYVHVEGYAALILMKTFADLSLPKAGMSRATEWLAGSGARPAEGGKSWRFPSGATLHFGYLDNLGDEQRYRTAEFQYIAFDELTRFPEQPYRFLFSRLRKPREGMLPTVPLRMRAATNPGGKHGEWVRRRFVPDEYLKLKGDSRFERCWWKDGRLFVPARIRDNPTLDEAEYRRMLSRLLPVERAQQEDGDWSAHEGGHFQAEWFREYRDNTDSWYLPPEVVLKRDCQIIVAVDPAGGTSESADYTAMVVGAITPRRQVLIVDVLRERIAVEEIVPRLADLCLRWRPDFVVIEVGFQQSAYVREAHRTFGIPTVQGIDPGGKSKLVRATPAILKAKGGEIWLPERAGWLEDYLSELCAFTGDDTLDAHDDQVDATAHLVAAMDQFHVGDDAPALFGRRGQ